ncbi:Dehydratase medium subunit [Pseudonocardia ammonioxydans]|uniref:Dehydratase medium subunit n=1 Tax=Pseudonocardia ammonioxydans TaxID=260086 RepID=A0A1I4UMJ5_PSUAM|nr:glycerol dehydratase reactivase beta/small subunit family protein [Pseudonocardia ammonioxydans]SFM90135.1 Dehydratase medium subunit [Pseudonocardia ammonioxydans]
MTGPARHGGTPERPSIVVRHHPDAPVAVLREVLAGAEEEGVPVLAWPDPTAGAGPPGDGGAVALAHRAARRSPLDTGVGIDVDGAVAVHHAKLPPRGPAFVEPAPAAAVPAGPAPPAAVSTGPAPPAAVSAEPAPPVAVPDEPAPPAAVSTGATSSAAVPDVPTPPGRRAGAAAARIVTGLPLPLDGPGRCGP